MVEELETKKVTPEEIEELREQDWYKAFIEDLQARIVETEFSAREMVINLWHSVGKRLAEREKDFKAKGISMTLAVSIAAQDMNRSAVSIWKALQFYKWVPEDNFWDKLPEGKLISWSKIVNKYLPTPREKQKEAEKMADAENEKTAEVVIPAKPQVSFSYNKELNQWTLKLNPDELKNIDFSQTKDMLREYLSTIS